MTLDEKIGQMIMPVWSSADAAAHVTTYRVGGFCFLANSSATIVGATNALQAISPVPLIFSIDCEAGSGARITDGTKMPMNMALAATRDPALATEAGRVTARECRAVGVQIGFGPVLDVNTEPINPIIGIRSYSDDPALVAQMGGVYVDGAGSEGLLCTFKHFPGHGAAAGDSHSSLPTINITESELQAKHVAPYAPLIGAGKGDLVMSAHVWYPCLDPGTTPWPATLSTAAMTGILRTQLNFQGVAISDSYGMTGLLIAANNNTADAARLGVQAGLDVVLMPNSVSAARDGIRNAVTSGTITPGRVDDAVRRILILKSRVGMPESTTVPLSLAASTLQAPEHLAVAKSIARKSLCQVRVNPGDLPLTSSQTVLCLTMSASGSIFYQYAISNFTSALQARIPGLVVQTVSTSLTSGQRTTLVNTAKTYQRVVVTSTDWQPVLAASQSALVADLLAAGVRVVYVSFGSPYHIRQWPALQNYFTAFCSHFESQAEMARVLTGESAAAGQWPVTISGVTGVGNWAGYSSPDSEAFHEPARIHTD